MRAVVLAFLVLAALLAMGCVETVSPLTQKRAALESAASLDTDGDGIPNIWKYTFEPVSSVHDSAELRMRREIVVTGVERDDSFVFQGYYRRNDEKSKDFYDALTNVATLSISCTYALDEVIPCDSEQQCINLCISKVRCLNGLNKHPDLNGTLYQTSVTLLSVKKKASDLRTAIALGSHLSEPDLDVLLNQRDELSDDIRALLRTPTYSNLLCSQVEFQLLQSVISGLELLYEPDTSKSEQEFFSAYNRFKISSRTSFSFDENAVIEVDEIIPEQFAGSRADIELLAPVTHTSDSPPISVRYRMDFKKVQQSKHDFGYDAYAPSVDWGIVMQGITYPSGTVRVLQLEGFGPYVLLRGSFYGLYDSLRQHVQAGFAVALTVFFTLLLIYLASVAVRLLVSAFVSIRRGEPLKEAVYRIAGFGGRNRIELAAAGIISLLAGGYLIASQGIPEGVDVLLMLVGNMNLLLGVLVFSLGLGSIYFLASDVIKGIILGERYYRAPIAAGVRKVLVEKKLREEIQRMRKDIIGLKEDVLVSGIAIDIGRVNKFIDDIAVTEGIISHGRLENAEIRMEKYLRAEYATLHQMLSVVLDQKKMIEEIREQAEQEVVKLDESYRQSLAKGVRIERKNWRDAISKYSEILSKDGYPRAKEHLEDAIIKMREETNAINTAIVGSERRAKESVELGRQLELELSSMKSEIEMLIERIEQPGAKVPVGEAHLLLNQLKGALQELSRGRAEAVEKEMSESLRKQFSVARDQLSLGIEHKRVLDGLLRDISAEAARIEELYTEAKSKGVQAERIDWDARARQYLPTLSSQGFGPAKEHLEKLIGTMRNERVNISSSIIDSERRAKESVELGKVLEQELQAMASEIEGLRESAVSSGSAVELGKVNAFLDAVSEAKGLLARGGADRAEELMNSRLRKEYASLKSNLLVGIDQRRILDSLLKEAEDEADLLDAVRRKAFSHNIEFSEENYRDKVYKHHAIISSSGFSAAKEHLENVSADMRKERSALESRISKVEHLKLTKFSCPVCARMTSLAFENCEHCGIPLSEGFSGKVMDFRHELESVAMELREKKISRSERIITSVDVLLDHFEDAVKTKKFDKAAELVPTIDEKVKHLQEILSKVVAQEVELGTYISGIRDRSRLIPSLIARAKGSGLDVSAYEKRFAQFSPDGILAEIGKMPVDEGAVKGKEMADAYSQIESDLKNMLAKHASSMDALERVNELFTEISTLITRGKGVGIDTKDYAKRLEALNLDALIDRMERNEAREDDLKGTVDSLSSMAEELGNKVALAESLHARVKAVESKVNQANRMVKECTEAGVSPFEEMEVLYSISVAPISNRIKSLRLDEADSMKAEVSRLEVEIEKALLGLKKKKGVLSAWPSWSKGIEALLKKQDKIDPAMLTGIPPEWRPWAMERFVGETELPVVLEGNRISRLKSMKGISKGDIDGVLEEMVGTGRIIGGAILRRDGLVISSRLAEGRDPSKVAAMGATAMQKAESASEALAKGEVSYILFNAAEGKQVIAKAGAQALIIAIIKPDEDLGFVILTIKKAGNKVSELIERL